MVTVRQGLTKLPNLKNHDHESIFNKLRKDNKSVKIREWQGYKENEYFSVPDLIQAMQNLSHNTNTTTNKSKSRKRTLSKSDQKQGEPRRKRARRK